MRISFKQAINKVVAVVACTATAVSAIFAAIPMAKAIGSSETLGTNRALGSPILNENNFKTEDWNPYEMICWGVFLSNFCQPLVDTYETAFTENCGAGSNGGGFKALWGGSGNDAANAKIIKALCEEAIAVQKINSRKLYVAYTEMDKGNLKTDTPSVTGLTYEKAKEAGVGFREAHFRDLFFIGADDCGLQDCQYDGDGNHHTFIEHDIYKFFDDFLSILLISGSVDKEPWLWVPEGEDAKQYDKIAAVGMAALPTFYVEVGESKELFPIFDYTDWWDIQIMATMINALRENDSTQKQFTEAFDAFWSNNNELEVDQFANITILSGDSNYIFLPSSVNQNITYEYKRTEKEGELAEISEVKPKAINILNSWTMNHYSSTASDEQIVLGLRQDLHLSQSHAFNISENTEFTSLIENGYPAFGETQIGHAGMFYYDLDSIFVDSIKHKKHLTYGEALNTLFSLDINNNETSTFYPLKFEIAGPTIDKVVSYCWRWNRDNVEEYIKSSPTMALTNNMYAASMLPNQLFEPGENKKDLLSEIIKPNGQKIPIFSKNGLAIGVRLKSSKPKNEPTNEGAVRTLYNFIYQAARGNIQSIPASSLHAKLKQCNKFMHTSDTDSSFQTQCGKSYVSPFIKQYPDYERVKNLASDWRVFWDYGNNETINVDSSRVVIAYPPSETMRAVSSVLGIKDGAEFNTYCTYIYMTYLDFYGIAASDTATNERVASSRFSKQLFPNSSIENFKNITDVVGKHDADFGNQADVEEETAQYAYLMLSPEEGREYRKTMVQNSMADWIYEQYNRTVYGSSSGFAGSASKAKSGFLSIETYSDNWLTAWFLEHYLDIVVWAIMGSIVLIIIIGLVKGKRATWFILSIIVIVNVFLLVPSSGELVPYITSSVTQNLFDDKMTYWSISQGVTNSTLEKDAYNKNKFFETLDEDEAKLIISTIKELSSLQTDTSLCVKQDISQKVTQKLSSGVYADIESYKSARWILPMVMQQFSGEDNTTEFIYKPLANIWDDLSNMYWYFNPTDAEFTHSISPTATSGQTTEVATYAPRVDKKSDNNEDDNNDNEVPTGSFVLYNNRENIFEDVVKDYSFDKDTNISNNSGIHYMCYCYEAGDDFNVSSEYSEQLVDKVEKVKDKSQMVHLVCYYLDSDAARKTLTRKDVLGTNGENYTGVISWGGYIDNAVNAYSKTDTWKTHVVTDNGIDIEGRFEATADSYDRSDRSSITSDLPYLWSTESPIYYFYSVIKDCFYPEDSFGMIINKIQGEAETGDDGNKVRDGFMYAKAYDSKVNYGDEDRVPTTGMVRDVLDLEEMFSNMIPYMYQTSIMMNGFDGVSGALGTAASSDGEPLTMSKNIQYYSGELQSWMYRCNWATKIMENPNFSKAATVFDADGNKYTVNNPLLIECYPSNRPMVFSEAQMYAQGLEESDLNLVELKCIQVNKDVSKQWTLLLNYVGTEGMTKEVMQRQMATDATMIFCQEFSSAGLLDTTYQIYPQSLDLRYLSFDSIAKMLIMNVSRNTSYIYGDTMLTVIEDTDMVTAVLLLIASWCCAFLVPLFRSILMALIFYLGFISIIRGLFYDNKTKGNVACGQLISNILFMLYTIAYYLLFYMMMTLTSNDEVLSVNKIQAKAGSPAWVILAVIVISIVYMVIMALHVKFCITNRKDMGWEQYSALASGIANSVKEGAGHIRDSVKGFFDRDGSSTTTVNNTKSIKGSGIKKETSNASSISGKKSTLSSSSTSSSSSSSSSTIVETDGSSTASEKDDVLDSAATTQVSDYKMKTTVENTENASSTTNAEDINAIIDAGSSMEDKS